MVKEIKSHNDLLSEIQNNDKVYCLLYKKGSDLSECALKAIAESADDKVNILIADVTNVRDIHTQYNITSAPSFLVFEKGEFTNNIKGCHKPEYYKALFAESIYSASNDGEKPQKRVTVYSTPTCTFCNQLKKYFDEKGIKYRDIDVSKDQKAAEEMVKRSGQQGVPQTDINGQIVIGFDRIKINKLLGIE